LNKKKIFSVVIPVHNGAKFLETTIKSVLSQTRPFDEIIIVDDASTDASKVIVNSEQLRGKVQYKYNEVPTGFVDAWNRAVKYATGDYVTILHQDDLLLPYYLDAIESVLNRYPGVRHLYTACDYIDEHGAVIRVPSQLGSAEPVKYSGAEYADNYLTGVMSNNHIHRCPGVTTERRLLVEQCTYRKEAGHIADDDFFMRVGAFTDVVGISMPLASYRIHTESETGKVASLASTLARDFLFQMKGNRIGSILADKRIIEFDKGAAKLINQMLCQGLSERNDDLISRALIYRDEFKGIALSDMNNYLPILARFLWSMSVRGSSNQLGKTIFAVRQFIKSKYKKY